MKVSGVAKKVLRFGALLFVLNLSIPGVVSALPSPIELPTTDGTLLEKAAPDECFDGVGVDYPAGPPCNTGKAKVNQAYIWGMAKSGDDIWLGTMANTHCLVLGGFLGVDNPLATSSYVCEFGQSSVVRNGFPPIPANAVPPMIGDFRPPHIYVYNTATQTLTEKVPPGPDATLLTLTLGLRAAGTLNDVVLLAGPTLSLRQGLNLFAFQASTGAFLGSTTLPNYINIRKFVVVDGVLYAGVGTSEAPPAKSGRVLRWQGSVATPFAFTEVGIIDSMASEIAEHEGKLFVTSWPNSQLVGSLEAGLYMSPALPPGGFSGPATEWTKVWTVSEYEADPVTASTYGGGALASFGGYLYWGTMHVPLTSTLAHFSAYPDTAPTAPEEQLQWGLRSERAISIFRGRDFGTAQEDLDVVYGYGEMPVYVAGAWKTLPNNMGEDPLWGDAGFNNPTNNYTWTMAVYGNRLWVGTMDWSWVRAELLNVPDVNLPPLTTRGADLWYFPSANSPALPESMDGMGNPSSYGIRTVLSDASGFYLGMANPMNLLTDPDAGPVGGWELIKLVAKPHNTPYGDDVAVPLQGGASITFCHVNVAGHTASLADPQEPLLPPLPNGHMLEAALLVGSSADWRTGCASDRLATLTQPVDDSVVNPRMLQKVWNTVLHRYDWVDITDSVSDGSVTGVINQRFLGVIAITSIPGAQVIPGCHRDADEATRVETARSILKVNARFDPVTGIKDVNHYHNVINFWAERGSGEDGVGEDGAVYRESTLSNYTRQEMWDYLDVVFDWSSDMELVTLDEMWQTYPDDSMTYMVVNKWFGSTDAGYYEQPGISIVKFRPGEGCAAYQRDYFSEGDTWWGMSFAREMVRDKREIVIEELGLTHRCVDDDGDGYPKYGTSKGCPQTAQDCDDYHADINPGALEDTANGIDDNCDGVVDN